MVKNKIAKKILFIVGAVLCVLFAAILVCNLTIIIKGVINPDVPPSVFGVTPMVVQSGSMSGNAEDHIEVGDLIFTVKPDTAQLEAGDIISYMVNRGSPTEHWTTGVSPIRRGFSIPDRAIT